MVYRRWLWALGVFSAVLCVFAAGQHYASAQAETARYFPATGHWVTGEFLTHYDDVLNPTEIYGAPITVAFEDSLTGLTVQYFEKARFEYHPDAPPGLQVKSSMLGHFLYREGEGKKLHVPANSPLCQSFPETSHQVCYAFLDYYEANNGEAQFGYPISGFEVHEGLIVQYFQMARFEWHPNNPANQRVTVSNLGWRYFYTYGEDTKWMNPPMLQGGIVGVVLPDLPTLELQARAFVHNATLGMGEEQTIDVIVQNQNLQPEGNVEVLVVVVLADGTQQELAAERTNEQGISRVIFDAEGDAPGIVTIKVFVQKNLMQAETRASFQLWW